MNKVEGRGYDILQKTTKRTGACWETVEREVFWSDSKTVLAWIRSEAGRYKEFMANRVSKIQETTKGTDWRWVSTSENPADIATRFVKQRFHLNLRTCETLGQNSSKDQKRSDARKQKPKT
ncbi:hypothetical protein LAZ67_20000642 [Cordylochernes scorpioides]|uniref:Uncharacterized protein n=1 Tax=Cordylochernes scorpioides TaxID=51811 RepID=A0ABY6LKA1_9ARAC|nr:hypothetical protein LAZ67_20000642 [Cordylochernes scorpioides]